MRLVIQVFKFLFSKIGYGEANEFLKLFYEREKKRLGLQEFSQIKRGTVYVA